MINAGEIMTVDPPDTKASSCWRWRDHGSIPTPMPDAIYDQDCSTEATLDELKPINVD